MPHAEVHHSAAVAERAAIVKIVDALISRKHADRTVITDGDLTALSTAIKDRSKLSPSRG